MHKSLSEQKRQCLNVLQGKGTRQDGTVAEPVHRETRTLASRHTFSSLQKICRPKLTVKRYAREATTAKSKALRQLKETLM